MTSEIKSDREVTFADSESDAFAERISALIEHAGSASALARLAGVSESVVRKWRNGKSDPSRTNLISLSEATGVSIAWLVTGEGPMRPGEGAPQPAATAQADALCVCKDEFDEEYVLVPGYHVQVSTGNGRQFNSESVKRRLAFRRKWLKFRGLAPEQLAIVFAKGDSMEPNIHNNNTLLIDMKDKRLSDGSIYVLRLGEDLYAKRLQMRLDGGVRLISDNKEYPAQDVPAGDLDQLDIIGKVVWIGKDFY